MLVSSKKDNIHDLKNNLRNQSTGQRCNEILDMYFTSYECRLAGGITSECLHLIANVANSIDLVILEIPRGKISKEY